MTTPKAPARRPAGQHSTPKRATPYPAKVKTRALEVIAESGIAAAHKATKVPRPTLSRWAKAAGIDVGEQARARTAAANDAVRAKAAEVTATTVGLLESHIAQAGHYLALVAGVNARAADLITRVDPDRIKIVTTLAGDVAVVEDDDAQAAQKVALALAGLPYAPRDAEGLVTRAIHDLQLLNGEATERGEMVVEFSVPRPAPADVTVVEQAQLAIEAP